MMVVVVIWTLAFFFEFSILIWKEKKKVKI